jgi:phosphate transport system permease protein
MVPSQTTFTGRARQRKTGWSVQAGEILSRSLITVGGIGTIAAICAICVFLVWVVYPLFLPASVSGEEKLNLPWKSSSPIHIGMDEDQLMAAALFKDGTVQVLRLDNGKLLERRVLFEGRAPTAVSPPGNEGDMIFGFADGTVRFGRMRWVEEDPPEDLPQHLKEIPEQGHVEFAGGLLKRTPLGRLLVKKLDVQVEEPLEVIKALGSPVLRIDHLAARPENASYCVLTEDGKLRVVNVLTKKAPGSLKPKTVATVSEIPLLLPPGRGLPNYVRLSGMGDNVYVVWEDGLLHRFNISDLDHPQFAETVNLLEDKSVTLTALQFLIGRTTLLAGDSSGQIRGWFGTRPADATTSDDLVLRAAHVFAGHGSAVTAIGASSRTHMLAAGYADGRVRVFYATSEKLLIELQTAEGQSVQQAALAPEDNGVAAVAATGMWHWNMDPKHPEATLKSLFLPVWYEDYTQPAYVWQTTGGEPKFGLWPLIFGTLKAAFYSLLIAVPLALLAALYTSEFLHPHVKAAIKPTIELMASLPSVVLGFLAALIFAPFIDRVLPSFLAGLVTIPTAFVLGAYLWQMVPEKITLRLARWRILFICTALPLGILGAVIVGPPVERLLFAGNFRNWLIGGAGDGAGGWILLLLPLSVIGTALLLVRVVDPRLRRLTASWSRGHCAMVDLLKFLAGGLLALLGAWLGALALNTAGFDPRTFMVGMADPKYDSKNSLIVGFVMGFAIIPIIYTIAEDALSAVPDHLRSASLGCGATRWQTAVHIIIPTAMSGLFSAIMVGLGRAVGETMIVLMATGNTAIIDWNIFNGFRTLSANIAVEMPEAVRDSTHYRTLYLTGLVLFTMTFLLNTVAEMVRLRFRKRAYQL